MCNHSFDIVTAIKSVIAVMESQGGKDKLLNDIMKDIFIMGCKNNIDLRLQYIPPSPNEADSQSRSVSLVDSELVNTRKY